MSNQALALLHIAYSERPTEALLEQLTQARETIMARGITDPNHQLVRRFDTILHILMDRGLTHEGITS